jgi:hypothetical protein
MLGSLLHETFIGSSLQAEERRVLGSRHKSVTAALFEHTDAGALRRPAGMDK